MQIRNRLLIYLDFEGAMYFIANHLHLPGVRL